MPKAYWTASYITFKDPEKQRAYAEFSGPAIAVHGGTFLARGGRVTSLEGFQQSRVMVTESPNFEAAVACYESDEYQAAHTKIDSVVEALV